MKNIRTGIKKTLKNPVRSMSWGYIIALGAIALLTIESHFLTAYIAEKNKEGVKISYNIEGQRSLIQHIILQATKQFKSGEEFDLYLLNQSIKQLEDAHNLMTKDIRNNQNKNELYGFYFQPPHDINHQVGDFIEGSKEFTALSEDKRKLAEDTGKRDRQKELFDQLYQKDAKYLASALSAALGHYQKATIQKTERYSEWQFWNALAILVVLALEALLIFRPMINKIDDHQKRLMRYALEDELTGLKNRRAFIKQANMQLRAAKRHNAPVTVVLSDLDKFKSINDTYGHDVGDLVLQHFAKLVTKHLRAHDVIGRIGGEEFAFLLPGTTDQKSFAMIDRLRDIIEKTPCVYRDKKGQEQTLHITASFGLVHVDKDHDSIEGLLKTADEGLYEAKNKGRNLVVRMEHKLRMALT